MMPFLKKEYVSVFPSITTRKRLQNIVLFKKEDFLISFNESLTQAKKSGYGVFNQA